MQFVLTAGYNRAPHVLALAELLRREGHEIGGLLVVSALNARRARSLVRQRGLGFLKLAVRRMFPGRRPVAGDADPILSFLASHRIRSRSLRRWAAEHGVPYRAVKNLNDQRSVEFVRTSRPDAVLYGGGGILSPQFIDSAQGRILNAHSGPLPHIRGMNACEWSVILGYDPEVTIHYIDRGIDTGAVIQAIPVHVEPGDTIDTLRAKCAVLGVEGLLDAANKFEHAPSPRTRSAEITPSRQCFVIAPVVREILDLRLRARGEGIG